MLSVSDGFQTFLVKERFCKTQEARIRLKVAVRKFHALRLCRIHNQMQSTLRRSIVTCSSRQPRRSIWSWDPRFTATHSPCHH